MKVHRAQEFVIAGYTRGTGRRAGTFGSLALAVYDDGELRYVGNVGTGFDDGRDSQAARPARAAASFDVAVPS